jgi:hypothetical protein
MQMQDWCNELRAVPLTFFQIHSLITKLFDAIQSQSLPMCWNRGRMNEWISKRRPATHAQAHQIVSSFNRSHETCLHPYSVQGVYKECQNTGCALCTSCTNLVLLKQPQTLKWYLISVIIIFQTIHSINHLTPELNPSAQRCLTRFFTGDFASRAVHFVNICLKNQQIHQLFIQFINYVWWLLHVSALHCHSQGAFLVPSERCSIEQSIEYCGWACCV